MLLTFRKRHAFGIGLAALSSIAMLFVASTPAHAGEYKTRRFLSQIDGGTNDTALRAYIDQPQGLEFSGNKDIYIADTSNNVIERISNKTGKLKRVAGSNAYGLKNGKASKAQFAGPKDIAVRGSKPKKVEVYVADTDNNAIRKIKNGKVTTFKDDLNRPRGVAVDGNTIFVSDTNNNRILGINRKTGATVEYAGDLKSPTKLTYWSKARSVIFINEAEGAVRAVNVDTGKVSDPIISGLEDIGGIYRDGRTLYVVASRDIGVFNEIWKVRLRKATPKGTVKALSLPVRYATADTESDQGDSPTSDERETDQINTPSDVAVEEEEMTWEEYNSWEQDEVSEDRYGAESVSLTGERSTAAVTCLPIKKKGASEYATSWSFDINANKDWQQQKYLLKKGYQGDKPFFRVKLSYTGGDEVIEADSWTKGNKIQSISAQDGDERVAPTNLGTSTLGARELTITWDASEDAETYKAQLWRDEERLVTFENLENTTKEVKTQYVRGNASYAFRVASCNSNGGDCGEFSDFYEFRTLPGDPAEIENINPKRQKNIVKTERGNFMTTLRFKLPKTKNMDRTDLQATVQLCARAKDLDHPDTVTKKRIYVLYKGGGSIVAWRTDGTKPTHYAGRQRFQDTFGKKKRARIGRPKAVVFSPDKSKMYISQNNKITVYDFKKKRLSPLAGHVMDSYTEGKRGKARFSDVTDMDISSNGKWLYVVDRNNNRIRRVNTKTGQTKYVSGAGQINFGFKTDEGNGYQEGVACAKNFKSKKKAKRRNCAYFYRPTGIALSPDGKTLYIAEGSSNRIRAVDKKTGTSRLVAGSGDAGFVDGSGGNAQFNGPYSVDVSSDGNTLYVADKGNNAIRAVDLANNNNVTTLFGDGRIGIRDGSFDDAVLAIPEGIEEENGVIYWTEAGSHTIRAGILSSRTVKTLSGDTSRGYKNGNGSDSKWNNPKGLDIRGNKLYVTDYANDLIRTVEL